MAPGWTMATTWDAATRHWVYDRADILARMALTDPAEEWPAALFAHA